ncbi:Na(+)/H(+) exchange regulatory cofactor NHE-RF1 [Liparis tanakae]|uniref:Na(+)/H(+) exchange regulatory cofactor NHE-RF1 n=1 Tax=Liparis tanakae TaxID=230148 RepID=A0A4Z2FLF5_9TELE|nr:Na(+)/H(+) exchange regulatory cofactor NHE-RF1 [Liparis tanakae]
MSNLRPKLCLLEKGASGYGFHLHGEKGKIGQFIRLVEADTPAAEAELRAGDRLAFVNGESVEGESHQQVVARIRATAGALELIVVDPDTAALLEKRNLKCRKEFVTEGIPPAAGGASDSDSERVDAQSNGSSRESTPAPRENGDAASQRSERLSVASSTKARRLLAGLGIAGRSSVTRRVERNESSPTTTARSPRSTSSRYGDILGLRRLGPPPPPLPPPPHRGPSSVAIGDARQQKEALSSMFACGERHAGRRGGGGEDSHASTRRPC